MASLARRVGLLAAALLLVAISCGDPLVDSSYRGVPLFSISGQTFGTSYKVQLENPTVRIALFWNTTTFEDTDYEKYVEQPSSGMYTQVPLAFVLNIFEAPPDNLLATYGSVRIGLARLMAYVDTNKNGQRDEDEPIVGFDASRTILYAPTEIAEKDSPTSGSIIAGFHLASLPLPCNGGLGPPADQSTGDCGVPRLGLQCQSDSDCGAGTCLTHFLLPWPRGSCAMRDPPPDHCIPKSSVPVRGPPETNEGYYVKACRKDSDCGREFPYVCDLMNSACMPTAMQQIQIGDDPKEIQICGAKPPQTDGGTQKLPDGGCLGPMGEAIEPFPDGGCPMGPMPDGGMMPPPPDGGMHPPPDGGMGQCPPGPDGGIPPRYPDGGCPGPPPGGDGGECPGPPGQPPPPRLSDGGCPMGPPPDGGV